MKKIRSATAVVISCCSVASAASVQDTRVLDAHVDVAASVQSFAGKPACLPDYKTFHSRVGNVCDLPLPFLCLDRENSLFC